MNYIFRLIGYKELKRKQSNVQEVHSLVIVLLLLIEDYSERAADLVLTHSLGLEVKTHSVQHEVVRMPLLSPFEI